MGLDDIRDDLMGRAQELKTKLVQEIDELTDEDMEEAGDDPDAIVSKVQEKTGESREQAEQRLRDMSQAQSDAREDLRR